MPDLLLDLTIDLIPALAPDLISDLTPDLIPDLIIVDLIHCIPLMLDQFEDWSQNHCRLEAKYYYKGVVLLFV